MDKLPISTVEEVLPDVRQGKFVIIVDDPSSELPKIVETLLQQGLVLESIEVIRPGLEQVFLEVTGELLHGTASVSEVT